MRGPLLSPHHDGSPLYVETQHPRLGDRISVWLRVPAALPLDGVWVRSTPDAEPKYAQAVVDRRDADATWWRAEVLLRNPITRYRWLLAGPGGAYRWVTGVGMVDHDVPDAHDFTISTHPAPPDWSVDAMVYQIFPDRFARSAGADRRPVPAWARPAEWTDTVIFRGDDVPGQWFGGDLDGIVEHLDHIADLGFNTLYLTPFFPAQSIHRYDAATFDHVDPVLGGDAALARLSAAVHARGMRLIGDLTTNHTGVTHEWFKAARADRTAPEREFYYFGEDDSFECWYDVPTLPKLRFGPELTRRMLEGPESVVGRWLRAPYQLDGWRIDVANMTGRRTWEDTNLEVARAIRATIAAQDPQGLLIAEHCHDASGDLSGEGWHGAMNYAGFLRPIWAWLRSPGYHDLFLGLPVDVPRLGGQQAAASMRAFQAVIPWRSLVSSWSLLGSHDTPRIRTVVGDAATQAVAAGVLFTSPGAPMMFMGDEFGGQGVMGEDARRPMPWRDHGGWDPSMVEVYRALVRLRSAHPALRRGGLRWAHADDESIVYLRETTHESLLCLAARGTGKPIQLPCDGLGLGPGQIARNIHGGADDLVAPAAIGGYVALNPDGPQFQVWQLPKDGNDG